MKAQLQIGNEMREGELWQLPTKSAEHGWAWCFRTQNAALSSKTSRKTLVESTAHFKSIGGIILGDAE